MRQKPKVGDMVRRKEFSGDYLYGLVLDAEPCQGDDAGLKDYRCTVRWFRRVKKIRSPHWLDKITVSESITYACTLEVVSCASSLS